MRACRLKGPGVPQASERARQRWTWGICTGVRACTGSQCSRGAPTVSRGAPTVRSGCVHALRDKNGTLKAHSAHAGGPMRAPGERARAARRDMLSAARPHAHAEYSVTFVASPAARHCSDARPNAAVLRRSPARAATGRSAVSHSVVSPEGLSNYGIHALSALSGRHSTAAQR